MIEENLKKAEKMPYYVTKCPKTANNHSMTF